MQLLYMYYMSTWLQSEYGKVFSQNTGSACENYQLYQVYKPFSRSPTRPGVTQDACAHPSCPSLSSCSQEVGSKGASLRDDSSTPMQQLRVLRKSSALHGCLPELRVTPGMFAAARSPAPVVNALKASLWRCFSGSLLGRNSSEILQRLFLQKMFNIFTSLPAGTPLQYPRAVHEWVCGSVPVSSHEHLCLFSSVNILVNFPRRLEARP